MSEFDISESEIARDARRDRDASAADRSGMRTGLAKSFALQGQIEERRARGERVGRKRRGQRRPRSL